MSFLKEQGALAVEFLRSDFRRLVLRCAAALAVFAGMGAAVGLSQPEVVEEALAMFADLVEEAGIVSDDGTLSVFSLLANNWQAMLMSVLYGFLPFVFLPMLSLFSNGFLMGIMAAWYQNQGIGTGPLLAGLIPHGIFELPALTIAIACGIHLCVYMTARVTGRSKRPLSEVAEELLRVLVLVVAPLVVAAAFVECYITPSVMELFM